MAPPLRFPAATAMTHAMTFLLALTLTGTPALSVACVTLCGFSTAVGMADCYEEVAQPASIAISAWSGTCAALLDTSLFLREEGRLTSLTSVRHVRGLVEGYPAPALVLRL